MIRVQKNCEFSLVCWKGPHGKELRVASGQQPARNWGPQSNSTWGTEFYHSHVSLDVVPSSSEPLGETSTLDNTSIAAL